MNSPEVVVLESFKKNILSLKLHQTSVFGPALKKPLLLLYLISQIDKGELKENRVFFTDVAKPLANLIRKFGGRNTPPTPEQPFHHLSSSNLWNLNLPDGVDNNDFSKTLSVKILKHHETYGYLNPIYFELLVNNTDVRISICDLIIDRWWLPEERAELKLHLDLPGGDKDMKKNIRDVLVQATSDIDKYYNYRIKLQSHKGFNENLIKLSAQTGRLKKALALQLSMKTCKIDPRLLFSEEDRKRLLGLIDECGEQVADHCLDSSAISLFEREVTGVVNNQKIIWEDSVNFFSGDVVNSLNSMSSLLDNPTAVQELITNIIDLRERWPITEYDIKSIKKMVKEGRALLNTLPIDDPEIMAFIDKLRSQEATLKDLNDKVLSWIRENHLEERIEMSFSK